MAIIENFFNTTPPKRQGTDALSRAADWFDKYSPVSIASNALVKPIVETFAKPFGEGISAAYELAGKEAPAWTRASRLASPEILALMRGGDQKMVEQLKKQGYEGAGFTDVLNVASVIPAGGALKAGGIFSRAAKAVGNTTSRRLGTGFVSNALKTATELAPASVGWGAAYGAASGLDERDSLIGVLGKTAVGGAAGLAFAGAGGILSSGATSILRTAPERAQARVNMIVNKRQSELSDVVAKNNKLSRIVESARRNGNDIVGELSKADTLVGSVTKDGMISTRGEGEALGKIDSVLDNVDSVIYDNLVRDGSTTSIDDLEKALLQKIDDSGLVFSQKENALRRVRQEVNAMRRQSTSNVVPLADVQRAKIQIKANYLDPEKDTLNKLLKNAYKEYIENNISSIDVKAANKELGELYAIREFVDALHGKRVKGGRLGKYFAQTLGAIVGSKGGPLGSILGAEIAGNVQERMLASRFGKEVGKDVTAGNYLTKAAQKGKSPRLMLPAPTGKPSGPRVYEPGVIQMGGPTTFEERAWMIGNQKLTLEDIDPTAMYSKNVQSEDLRNTLASLKTVEDFDTEITKRVEKFRQEAGLMAEREGAGVKYRNVEDAVGNVNFVAKDFSLAKAKAAMKKQADSLKKYAQEMLYENDADFRAIVDAQDALMESRIIDVKATDNSKAIDEIMDWIDNNIKKTESTLKDIEGK